MASVNIAVKNALKFISLIQNVCDEKRLLLEQKQTQEFSCFLLEWKNLQKTKKTCEEIETVKRPVKEECKEDEVLLPEEEEALMFADSLLEKARSIRSKSKVSLNKRSDGMKNHRLQVDVSNSGVSVITSAKLESLLRIGSNDLKLNEKRPPRSKSSTLPVSQKTDVVPRSKSGTTFHVPKNVNKKPETCLKKNAVVKEGGKCAKEKKAISSLAPSVEKLYVGQKCLKYKPKCEEKESTELYSNISTDFTQNAKVKCDEEPPTIKYFIQELKSKLDAQPSFISKSCVWYPFLTFKNQECLLSKLQCKSFCSFHKTYQLIHRLQETMFWIELMCLIAKEILPHLLKFDGSDLNRKKLRNYIRSIFVSTSQRMPIFPKR